MHERAALLTLSLLLAGCANAPVAQSPDGLFRDELFAQPSGPVSVAEVFALSAPMREFLERELGSNYKGKRQALIDAVSQGQLRLEYDSVRTRNAAEAFDAKAGNCLSLVIMTAAFAKALGLEVQYNSAIFGDLWSRSGNIYFLNGHVNLTLGKRYSDPRTLYDAAETMTIDFLPGNDLRGLRSTQIDEPTILAMYPEQPRGRGAGARPARRRLLAGAGGDRAGPAVHGGATTRWAWCTCAAASRRWRSASSGACSSRSRRTRARGPTSRSRWRSSVAATRPP